MLTTDHYECTWDLLSSIPSLEHPGLSVREETVAFNVENPAHSRARLVARRDLSYLNGSWIDGADWRMRRTLTGVPSETNRSS
ncbi:protein of unknown function [Bradyrhizobium vignae]|uniref:Uncharacterized protein n=1 Tax=Bradyrhizobium vignae TaxID=1549949 RepID=A0A2U3QCD4_9BRAD|nr:protein of unknown function [Bradyrhizobium vignae]